MTKMVYLKHCKANDPEYCVDKYSSLFEAELDPIDGPSDPTTGQAQVYVFILLNFAYW